MGNLLNKVAIVTGAAGGLGRSHALALAKEGSHIAAVDMVAGGGLSGLVEEIRGLGRRAIGIKCDVSKGHQVEEMVKQTLDEFGRVDILVNNAGVLTLAPITKMSEEEWDWVISVNLKGTFLCCKYVIPHMIRQRSGNIINIGSISGRDAIVMFSHYSASKAAVHSLTQSLAKELAPYNIRVNAVAPGIVNTPMIQGISDTLASLWRIKQEEVHPSLCSRFHLLGKEITPDDVSNAVVWLVSDGARNLTGEVIYVDGGHP